MTRVSEILNDFPGVTLLGTDTQAEIREIKQLDPSIDEHTLSWCNDKNLDKLSAVKRGIIIVSPRIHESERQPGCTYLVTSAPRALFGQVIKKYFMPPPPAAGVSATARIAEGVRIGKNVFIGEHVVVEAGCSIGDNTQVGHNTILHANTQIGSHVKIGCNNTIGGVGFGYEPNESGEYELMPHIGNVVIEDYVEIGNNTCIDRAVLGSTLLHKNVKVDNLVHIAHGVTIGENSLIIAHAMIGGSAVIGKNAWVSPTASIINKGKIHDGALVGMGAVVVKEVEKNTIVAGNPARFLKNRG